MTKQFSKKTQRAWVLFDWANSAYSLVITSTIFPQIFNAYVGKNPIFLGINFGTADTLYTYSISFSFLILVLVSPLLGAIADYSGRKLLFLKLFTTIGSLACVGLYFFNENQIWIGVLGAILGSLGFSGSMLFYNAFLPEIALFEEQDRLSAKGYSYGYLGSSLLLIALLVAVGFYEELGFSDKLPVFQLGFIAVGLWWMGWAQYTFRHLPTRSEKKEKEHSYLKTGWTELKSVYQELKKDQVMKLFLRAFFAADLALQTLIIVAPLVAISVIGMEGVELIKLVLLMQFLGMGGAFIFSKLSQIKGNIFSLGTATLLYVFICLDAFFIEDKNIFYVLGGLLGFALGGMQSQARSAFSKLIPNPNHTASFFSFYDVTEKVAILTGTFLYAGVVFLASEWEGVQAPKVGIALLGIFFLIAFILWLPLRKFKNRFDHG